MVQLVLQAQQEQPVQQGQMAPLVLLAQQEQTAQQGQLALPE
jgi:hypothetical protein